MYLPYSSTIRSWAASIDCEPAFFCDVIRLIGKVAKTKPHMLDVVLIVDAMDQKKKCYIGRVEYGTAVPEAGDNLATEALFFMIGSVTGHWKHPISYFLQNKISASVQAQLIKDFIGLLHHEDFGLVQHSNLVSSATNSKCKGSCNLLCLSYDKADVKLVRWQKGHLLWGKWHNTKD